MEGPLLELHQRLRMLSPVGEIVVDSDERVVIWNEWMESASGLSSDWVRGQSLEEVYPEGLSVSLTGAVREALARGCARTLSTAFHPHPLPLENRQFRERFMSQRITVAGLEVEDGARYCVIHVVDTSEATQREGLLLAQRKELKARTDELLAVREQLEVRNRELAAFAHTAAHDLKAPARRVGQFARILAEECGDDLSELGQSSLGYIRSNALAMGDLITNLLGLAKADLGDLSSDWFPLSAAVDAAVEALAEEFEESDAILTSDDLPEVHGDLGMITQLFQNLIENALKYVDGSAPKLQVTAEEIDGQMVIGLRDQGIGIQAKFAESVFEPFRRLHSGSEYSGSGIGLATCRTIVRRHGGEIWLAEGAESGCHFRFTLASPDESVSGRPA